MATARDFLAELDEEIRQDTALRPVKKVTTADEILSRYNFETTFADKLKKVGFFGQDNATQTDTSEIVPINQLAEALRTLMDEFINLKRDFTLTKGALLSGLDEKLRSKANELYCRINTKVEEMEQMHLDRVNVVRAAFRQQLADILAAIRAQFFDLVQEQLRLGKAKMQKVIDQQEEKIKELHSVMQRQASMIEILKKQLGEAQKQLHAALEDLATARIEPVRVTPPPPQPPPPPPPQPVIVREPTPKIPTPPPPLITEEELQALKNELARFQDELRDLRNDMAKKAASADSLGKELHALKDALEKERAANTELRGENEVLKAQLESTTENYKQLLEQQKAEFELKLATETERVRQEAYDQAMTEASQLAEKARLQIDKLQEDKQRLEDLIAKLRSDVAHRDGRILELLNSGKNEQTLVEQINRLTKEVARLSAMWEKKFAIVKQRMNALKDEAYLRSQLQRQAAQLHQATVQYAADYLPVGIVAGGASVDIPMKKSKERLPDIAQPERIHKARAQMSYSVSAASGKATTNGDGDRGSSDDEDVTKYIDTEAFKPFNLERS